MKQIRIQNVRSLRDTGMVPITGITLLVGENSSGKSTFLRMFPLIRQSISKRTDGPLLWAGDVDDYVDFGSFSETVTNDGADSIALHFAFDFPHIQPRIFSRFHNVSRWERSETVGSNMQTDKIIYSATIRERIQSSNLRKWSGREYVSKLQVKINETTFDFTLDMMPYRGSVTVDGMEILKVDIERSSFKQPEMLPSERLEHYVFGLTLPATSGLGSEFIKIVWERILAHIDVTEQDVEEYLFRSARSSIRAIMQYVGAMLCIDNTWENILQLLQEVTQKQRQGTIEYYTLFHFVEAIQSIDESKRNYIFRQSKLLYFYEIYDQIDRYLSCYFRQVHYIAPLRATAERYYRQRNLAIDEVDYQGKNLPIFLNGLTAQRLKGFQTWTQEFFGFKVLVEKNGGHLSVKIATATENGVNLSDTGFGYSQILPIITQLWDLSTRSRFQKTPAPLVVAIEQPELHLHPGLQAKLAKAFIASIQLAKKYHYQLQLLLETHSETIVNYFGRAIAMGEIKKEDVSVLLFEKSMDTRVAEVRTSRYDEDGYLIDWPIGFFAPKE